MDQMASPCFGLDVPIDGRYADPHLLTDLAVEAEHAGWDGFFIQDIIYSSGPLLDPTVLLAAIAARTKTIRIGAFMTALPRRRPWKVARELLTLDHLSDGRVTLGVGLGFQLDEFRPFGESYDVRVRAEKLDEGLEIINGMWQGQPVRFHGKHYQVDLPATLPRPVQSPRIPIWVAGGWPRRGPFLRAARWDGIYVMTVNQETNHVIMPDEVRAIKALILSHRHTSEPFDIGVNVDIPLDKGRAAEMVQPYFEAGATWCIVLAPQTVEDYLERMRAGPPKR
jgi:alkanesulfonate monooxygenase SsuD/methylene tetrahydromethanopterin reductase-like flavin-dependent oxidoreductase (luciferase family)